MTPIALTDDARFFPGPASIMRRDDTRPWRRLVDDVEMLAVAGNRELRFVNDVLGRYRLDRERAAVVAGARESQTIDGAAAHICVIVHITDVDRAVRVNGNALVAM